MARGDRGIDAAKTLDSVIRQCRRNGVQRYTDAYKAERDHYDDSRLEGCWQRVT